MAIRKGLTTGSGRKGYYNIQGRDPLVHRMSAKGIKQPQLPNNLMMNLSANSILIQRKDGKKMSAKEIRIADFFARKQIPTLYQLPKGGKLSTEEIEYLYTFNKKYPHQTFETLRELGALAKSKRVRSIYGLTAGLIAGSVASGTIGQNPAAAEMFGTTGVTLGVAESAILMDRARLFYQKNKEELDKKLPNLTEKERFKLAQQKAHYDLIADLKRGGKYAEWMATMPTANPALTKPSNAKIEEATTKEHIEHPKFTRAQARQIAIDHLKDDPNAYGGKLSSKDYMAMAKILGSSKDKAEVEERMEAYMWQENPKFNPERFQTAKENFKKQRFGGKNAISRGINKLGRYDASGVKLVGRDIGKGIKKLYKR